MNRTDKRNLLGSIACYILSTIFGGLGIAFFMLREVWQAYDLHDEIEKDDIVRYSIVGVAGCLTQIIILSWRFL